MKLEKLFQVELLCFDLYNQQLRVLYSKYHLFSQ